MQHVAPTVRDIELVSQKENRSIPPYFCHSATNEVEYSTGQQKRRSQLARAEVCPLPGDALCPCLCKSPCPNPWGMLWRLWVVLPWVSGASGCL